MSFTDQTGDVWALRCSCPLHPTTGHAARPIGKGEPPTLTTTKPPVDGGLSGPTGRGNETRAKGTTGPGSTGGTRRRRRHYRPRALAFVDLATRAGLTDEGHRFKLREGADGAVAYLLRSLPVEVERVLVLGPRPGGTLDGFYEWAGSVGRVWRSGSRGHYIENPELPVLRYESAGDEGERRNVEIMRAKAWIGDGPTTVDALREGMALAGKLIAAAFDAPLLATPATTGRDLFLRTIPRDRAWPVLDAETQELIRSTTGQGRIEFVEHTTELPRLVECDGRFMYAALCWGLGVGPVERTTDGGAVMSELESDTRAVYRPARYRVRFTVPKGWDKLGLIGVMGDGRSWSYPSEPGRVAESWIDGAELFVALRAGWRVDVLERVAFQTGGGRGPLDTWARKLAALWRDVYPDDETDGARTVARSVLRSILLHGLGAFVGRDHVLTRSVPVADAAQVPADAINLREEAGHVWYGVRRPPAWPELSHPEWPAAVWGRCRARMATGPGPSGFLHAPPGSVVAIRTDAIYLTEFPGWPDDGKVGRLRVKRALSGPLSPPRSVVELLRMKGR